MHLLGGRSRLWELCLILKSVLFPPYCDTQCSSYFVHCFTGVWIISSNRRKHVHLNMECKACSRECHKKRSDDFSPQSRQLSLNHRPKSTNQVLASAAHIQNLQIKKTQIDCLEFLYQNQKSLGDIPQWYHWVIQDLCSDNLTFVPVGFILCDLLAWCISLSRQVTAVTKELCSYQQLSGIIQHRESFTALWNYLLGNWKT